MLEYSYLYANNICNNFLYCLGYGINCCLNIDDRTIKLLYGGNVDDYNQTLKEEGCDSFIITNLVNGKSLDAIRENAPAFTPRQIFELVYSYLCSVYYFSMLPADRHLDNIMINETNKGLIIKSLTGDALIFNDTSSIVHIDYQAVEKKENITYADIQLFNKYIDPRFSGPLKAILNTTHTPVEKMNKLINFFQSISSDKIIGNNYVTLYPDGTFIRPKKR
jgi:hypothetical protein